MEPILVLVVVGLFINLLLEGSLVALFLHRPCQERPPAALDGWILQRKT